MGAVEAVLREKIVTAKLVSSCVCLTTETLVYAQPELLVLSC